MTWKLDRDEYYFRILDSKKQIAGYFDPDYGRTMPEARREQMIDEMWKNHDAIPGGYLMVGLVKFGIFGGDYNSDVFGLERQMDYIGERILKWKDFIASQDIRLHFVNISHTDQDMLTITIPLRFQRPVPLERGHIYAQLEPMLGLLQRRRLL